MSAAKQAVTKTIYGSKVLATLTVKRERLAKQAHKALALLQKIEEDQAKLEQQILDNENLFRRKAARAKGRLANQRKGQLFAWGTMIERELLSDRLDGTHWRTWLEHVFADDPAELGRATLGLEMRADGVDHLPRHDRQVWRLRWGVAVERALELGEIKPENLAARVMRSLDQLDHKRAIQGIERVIGRALEIREGLVTNDASDTAAAESHTNAAANGMTSAATHTNAAASGMPSVATHTKAATGGMASAASHIAEAALGTTSARRLPSSPVGRTTSIGEAVDHTPARVLRLALMKGVVKAADLQFDHLGEREREAIRRGLAGNQQSLTDAELAIYEQGLAALLDSWSRAGQWDAGKTAALAAHLR